MHIYILTVFVVLSKSSSAESTIKQLAAGSNVQDCIPETKNKNLIFKKLLKLHENFGYMYCLLGLV